MMIIFWNSGNQIIDKTAISAIDPLRIRCNTGDSLVGISLLNASRKANDLKYTYSTDGEEIILSFDYLNPGDGFVIEVMNKGKFRPLILGEIRGDKINNNGKVEFYSGSKDSKKLGIILFLLSSVMLIMYRITGIIPPIAKTKEVLISMIIMGYVCPIFVMIFAYKNFPSRLVPQKMNDYKSRDLEVTRRRG